jgi:hypothetical protein
MGRNGTSGTSPFDGNAAGNDVFLHAGMNRSHPLELQFYGAEPIRCKAEPREAGRMTVSLMSGFG